MLAVALGQTAAGTHPSRRRTAKVALSRGVAFDGLVLPIHAKSARRGDADTQVSCARFVARVPISAMPMAADHLYMSLPTSLLSIVVLLSVDALSGP